MKIVYSLIFALIARSYSTTEASDESCFSHTLDLAHIDPGTVFEVYKTYYNIHEKSFFTRGKGFFGRILDKENVVWEAALDEACPLVNFFYKDGFKPLFLVYTKFSGDVHTLYYEKSDGLWKLTCKEHFEATLEAMKHDDKSFMNKATVLTPAKFQLPTNRDIPEVNDKYIVNIMTKLSDARIQVTRPNNENPFLVIRPTSGVTIPRVMDGVATIWEAKHGDSCEAAYFLAKDNKVTLAQLTLRTRTGTKHLCYEKNGQDGEWIELPHEEYEAKVDKIIEYLKPVSDDSFFTNSTSLLLAVALAFAVF